MTKEHLRSALANIIKRARPYSDLWLHSDFQTWRTEQVEPALERLKNEALTADQTTEQGRLIASAKIMAYQECKAIFGSVFKVWEGYEKEARKKLKTLDDKPDEPQT